jgi:glycosyltransferase involved in cell wall biosynthesis
MYGPSAPWECLTNDLFTHPLDFPKYREASILYDSVHIGDLFLIENMKNTSRGVVDASVLIPCRNAELTLARAIGSILDQDFGEHNVEIVVVDDASEDASPFIATVFSDKIRLFRRPRNEGGIAGCLDFGLQKCRGDVIIRMDADDEALPGRILSQLGEMAQRPALGVLGTQCFICHQAQQPGSLGKAPAPVGPASVFWSLFFYCPLVHPSVCLRKKAVEDVGGYSKSGERMEDLALWHILASTGKWELDNLDILGLVLHKSPNSVTSKWNIRDSDEAFARMAVAHLKQKCPEAAPLSHSVWMAVCHPDRYAKAISKAELQLAIQVLEILCKSITEEYKHESSEEDLEFVQRDCEARKVELQLLC